MPIPLNQCGVASNWWPCFRRSCNVSYQSSDLNCVRFGFDCALLVCLPDGRIPLTLVTNTPSSGSSDTVIGFTSDVPVATFEYRMYRGRNPIESKLMRNWTLTLSPIDYKDWLAGGTYTFQVTRAGTLLCVFLCCSGLKLRTCFGLL